MISATRSARSSLSELITSSALRVVMRYQGSCRVFWVQWRHSNESPADETGPVLCASMLLPRRKPFAVHTGTSGGMWPPVGLCRGQVGAPEVEQLLPLLRPPDDVYGPDATVLRERNHLHHTPKVCLPLSDAEQCNPVCTVLTLKPAEGEGKVA